VGSLLSVKYLVKDPVEKVALSSSNLQRSVDYWNGILGLEICSQNDSKVVLKFPSDQTELELEDIGKPILLLSAFWNTI
jgi:catechol-2,3-dioxygenase